MEIKIGDRLIGDGHPTFVIGEIGINHNGSVETARKLIYAASAAGCEAVKFQKRTIHLVYSKEELDRERQSPFGTTNGALKLGLELDGPKYRQIAATCQPMGMLWFASCWDTVSVDFMEFYDPPAYKIASASITDLELVDYTAATGRPIILSTGMSTLQEIDAAVDVIRAAGAPLLIMHCVATYPSEDRDLNLRCIPMLKHRYECPVGYSGHERGLATTLAAVAMGACAVERHITLDRTMWGSDQAASIEPHALCRLVRDIRAIEAAMGDGTKRVLDAEKPIAEKLRKKQWQTTS